MIMRRGWFFRGSIMDLGTCVLDIQSLAAVTLLGWRTKSLYNAFNLLSWFASARAHSGQLGKIRADDIYNATRVLLTSDY